MSNSCYKKKAKILYKIEQSSLERFLNYILWDFERSDNIESKVTMADNLGPMAWLFLPENEQVQYLQKIALRAENPSGPKSNSEKRRKDEKDENGLADHG